eukprot:252046-Amorphochlora_amoeboformis.AAC.1
MTSHGQGSLRHHTSMRAGVRFGCMRATHEENRESGGVTLPLALGLALGSRFGLLVTSEG